MKHILIFIFFSLSFVLFGQNDTHPNFTQSQLDSALNGTKQVEIPSHFNSNGDKNTWDINLKDLGDVINGKSNPSQIIALQDTTGCTSWTSASTNFQTDMPTADSLLFITINGTNYPINLPMDDGSTGSIPPAIAALMQTAIGNAITSAGYSATTSVGPNGIFTNITYQLIVGNSPLTIQYTIKTGGFYNNLVIAKSVPYNCTYTNRTIKPTDTQLAVSTCPAITLAYSEGNLDTLRVYDCNTNDWRIVGAEHDYNYSLSPLIVGSDTTGIILTQNGVPKDTIIFDKVQAVNNLQLNSGVIERGNLLQGGSQPADFTRNIYNWLGTTYKDHWQSSGDSELFSINGSQTINPTNTTNSGTGAINIGIGAVNGNYKLNIGGALWLDNGRGSVMIGNTTGINSTSSNSVYIGGSAGAVESGNNCISIGNATAAFSNGDNNLTFGYLSGFSNNGTNNIQMGSFENSRNSVGNDNISLGTQTLRDNVGSNNVAIGSFTATNNTGGGSVIIGGNAGQGNSGSNSIIIGTLAGVNNTGDLATLVGHSAGYNNKGFQVSSLGYSAGKNIKLNADYNTTFGAFSGMEYAGISNSSFGFYSGSNVTNTSSFLSLFGAYSGENNTGNNCTLIGAVGVGQNNTGDHVTAIGTGNDVDGQGRVTARNNTGDFAIAVGAAALQNNQSDKTIGIGVQAGDIGFGSISEGSIAIGTEAARQFDISPTSSIHRIAIGTNAMDIYKGGNYSIAIGYKALSNNNGDHVIAIGKNAGDTNAQPNRFIISNDELPSFPDRATALASITVALGAAVNNTYLYYNASNGAIEAVRL